MESLTQEQLDYIERHGKTKNPKTIAKDLKLELRHVQSAIRSLNDPKRAPLVARAAEPATRRFTNDSWIALGFVVAIIVLGWFAYGNNLGDGWHFDDHHSILMNDAIKAPSFSTIYHSNQYRQVLYWVFAGSWALHGREVRGWHIENNLIHILNALLVYALAFLTLRAPAAAKQTRWPHVIAGIAATIFVLHPLQTQAVTYITQRTESLCATFYLAAMILYAWARLRRVNGRAKGTAELAALPVAAGVATMILSATFLGLAGKLSAFLVISALAGVGTVAALAWFSYEGKADPIESALFLGALAFSLVACETKEIAGTIPGAVLLWELVFMRPSAKTSWLERARSHVSALPYAAMLALLPILAVAVGLDARLSLREGVQSIYDIKQISGSQYVLTELNVLATYVRLYLLPWGQSLDYDYVKRSSLMDGPTLLSLLALLSAVALAIRVRRSQPVFTFAVFFMLGVLAPTSLFVLPDFIFEHRVYLPLAGAALVTAVLAEKIVRAAIRDERLARQVLVAASVPVLAVCLVLTRTRNEVWANDESLWSDCHAKNPGKPRPLTNLGLYYQNVEPQRAWLANGDEVAGQFIDGAQLGNPTVWVVRTIFPNMRLNGVREFSVPKSDVRKGPVEWGGLEKAEKYYQDALAIDADYYKARNNFALCEIQRGILALEQVRNVESFLASNKSHSPDEPVMKKALATKAAFEQEALARFHRGEDELKDIIRRHPDDNVSLMNLGNLYFGYLDRLDDAIAAVEKSISLEDREAMGRAVLGEMYFGRGCEFADQEKHAAAIADYQKAITNYRLYIERAGSTGNPETYRHVVERMDKATRAIKEGGTRAEGKVEPGRINNPFENRAGANAAQGPRWKPPKNEPPKDGPK